MKKIIILCIVFMSFAHGFSYDDILLKTQASIFPKIMLLDKKLNDKLIDGKIIYTIVYEKDDYNTALDINKFIDANYKGYFNEYAYKINLVEFSNLSNETQASAIYVLNSRKYIGKVAEIARQKGIISFSYDTDNLKNGFMFSLAIEKSTIIYLEKGNLYTKKVDFVDSLLQIVKFTENSTFKDKSLLNFNPELYDRYAGIFHE